jgi:hypothetical protein
MEVAMTVPSEPEAAKDESLAIDTGSQLARANRYAFSFLADTRSVLLDEMLFAGNEFLDRAITETQLFNEFISKMAGAHSLKDLGAMYQECSRHQLEFIRRDTERLLKHGEHIIDNTSKLAETWRPN